MFLWTTPRGLKVFRQSLDQAKASATLAGNQGLYNGFLAAGLIWGLVHPEKGIGLTPFEADLPKNFSTAL